MAGKPAKPAAKKPPEEKKERGKRPDLRIVAKKRDGSEYVPIATFWHDEETGMMRGGLDRQVKGVTVVMADDTRHSIGNGPGGAFYVNAYRKREGEESGGSDEFGV